MSPAPSPFARVLSRLFLGAATLATAVSLTRSRSDRPAPVLAHGGQEGDDRWIPQPPRGDGTARQAPGGAGLPSGGMADRAPGDEGDDGSEPGIGHVGYAVGLGLAVLLTAVAFGLVRNGLVWAPGIPIAISVLAVAQMGVHLVFFLHIGSGPDSTNNILALAFGVLIVFLLIAGSLWIMAHLNHNMMSMDQIMRMQR